MTKLVELFIHQLSAEEKSANTTAHYIEVLERFEKWLIENHSLTLSESDIGKVSGRILVEYYQILYQRRLRPASRNNYSSHEERRSVVNSMGYADVFED